MVVGATGERVGALSGVEFVLAMRSHLGAYYMIRSEDSSLHLEHRLAQTGPKESPHSGRPATECDTQMASCSSPLSTTLYSGIVPGKTQYRTLLPHPWKQPQRLEIT